MKRKTCLHVTPNYITDSKGGLVVWCNDCGETLSESVVYEEKLKIYGSSKKTSDPEHELDVIQRLSEAYRKLKENE